MNDKEEIPNWMKQSKAASHIQEQLSLKGINIPSQSVSVNGQQWTVFSRRGRQLGVDRVSGIWLRESANAEWRCVATEHTMSSALMAIDFLARD